MRIFVVSGFYIVYAKYYVRLCSEKKYMKLINDVNNINNIEQRR